MFSLLNRLGLDNLLQEVMSEERSSSRAAAENGGGDGGDDTKPDNSDSDDDYDRKSDNAVDYSDINELADDMPVCFFFFMVNCLTAMFMLFAANTSVGR